MKDKMEVILSQALKQINFRGIAVDFEQKVMERIPEHFSINDLFRFFYAGFSLRLKPVLIAGFTVIAFISYFFIRTDARTIRFQYTDPDAKVVSLVGDFNDWNKNSLKFSGDKSGHWILDLKLKKGRYRYLLFINDSEWKTDPHSSVIVDDGFGGKNNIIDI